MIASTDTSSAKTSLFDSEMATYRAHLPELLKREGDYVVIRGEKIAGVCESYEAALGMGYDQFGAERFMVKQISEVEPITYFPH